jgi:uncharacterized membrane protein YesL
VLNVAVVAVFAANLTFYGATESTVGIVILIALAAAGLLWLAIQIYFWPFMLTQEQKHVRIALKNALFLTLAEPLYTSVILSTAALVVLISAITVLPIAVFTLSFTALLANRAVIERLTTYGKLPDSGPSITHGDCN